MLSINTSNVISTRKVLIDGHMYTVRKAGAREQLAIVQMQRRAEKLQNAEKVSEAEADELQKMLSEMYRIYESWFDDGKGGKKAKALLGQLGWEELSLLVKQIWEDKPEPSQEASTSEPEQSKPAE